MEIPEEIMKLLEIINGKMILVYVAIFIVAMYLIISFFTWSFIKPLKYLGIPTLISGIVFTIIRFIPNAFINLIEAEYSFIKIILPSMLKPILINGILCILTGVVMIVLYSLINKSKKESIIIDKIDQIWVNHID